MNGTVETSEGNPRHEQCAEKAFQTTGTSGTSCSDGTARRSDARDCVFEMNPAAWTETHRADQSGVVGETQWELVDIQAASDDFSVEHKQSLTSIKIVERTVTAEDVELCVEKATDRVRNGSLPTALGANLLDHQEGGRPNDTFKATNSSGRGHNRRSRKTSLLSRRMTGRSTPSMSSVMSRESLSSTLNARLRSWFQPMDNKMNMKVFGSRKAMVDEQIRYSEAGWIIHPTSLFR